MKNRVVVSGMRPTGRLHLGHYHGVLKNWVSLQNEYDCYFFVADWHALTTHYQAHENIAEYTWQMVADWLIAGLNPDNCKIFIQSQLPEHAQLHLLLSMLTPVSWLERIPSYKDQQQKLKDLDLATYGFLGYPVLQSADILLYKATHVPVGEDQLPHIEVTREIARHFNHLYGRTDNFQELANNAINKLEQKPAKLFRKLLQSYQERGDIEALEQGREIIEQANLSLGDTERLQGFLEGKGKAILPEPQPLLTEVPKLPGVDGQKMSKSYHNTIDLLEAPQSIAKKIKTMPTDPARVRRCDPGEPTKCPVWDLHKVYSTTEVKEWVQKGCRMANIGCLDCKAPLIDAICQEQQPMQERAKLYRENTSLVKSIVQQGTEAAKECARDTLAEVKDSMGIANGSL